MKLNTKDNFTILYLTNNNNTLDLCEWLSLKNNCILFSDKVDISLLNKIKPDIIISYNYKYIITNDVISYMKSNIVNLHISYLPWNKGSNPNFWSFIENTPKGVSIHLVDATLDTGAILFQKEIFFDEAIETLKTSYKKLHREMKILFKDNWENIKEKNYKIEKQSLRGSYHNSLDYKTYLHDININYDETIIELKDKFNGREIYG